MIKYVRPILAVSIMSSCFVLLSACGGGNSGGATPKSSAITASANIPGTVDSNSTFNVSVSLTATNPAKSTASVQVVDTGSVTPQINCGQPQTLTINAPQPTTFSCLAPQANLGGSNTHEIQVDVNSTPNLSSPVSVSVVNGGRVDVQLTSASGSVITAAAPGQTVDVAFSTITTPAGTGQYTVTAPSGWQLGNNGVCNISSTSTSCKVPVTVASGAANGPYSLAIGAELGSSLLSSGVLSLSVQSQAPSNDMSFDLSQNISDTLYANSSSSSKIFTYQPIFLFKNTSGSTLSIGSVSASGLSNVTYGCNIAQPNQQANYTMTTTPSCSLSATGLYAVSGTLNNSNIGALPAASSISIAVSGSGKTYVQHDLQVVFVPYVNGHVAVRVVNKTPQKEVHIAASVAPPLPSISGAIYMVTFPTTSAPYVGTRASSSGLDYSGDQLALAGTTSASPTKATSVFYLPYGKSGEIYLTRYSGGFNTTTQPQAPTSSSIPPFLQIEFTYTPILGTCIYSSGSCEQLAVDQTYVNFVSTLGTFNVMGNTAPFALDSENSTHGVTTDKSQSEIFNSVAKQYEQAGGPWPNLLVPVSSTSPTAVLAPIQEPSTFPSNYYQPYVSSLWTYLQTHYIYVYASGTANSSYATVSDRCVLQGHVSSSTNQLEFTAVAGTGCPTYGYSTVPTFGMGNQCGTSGTAPCADTVGINGTAPLVFDEFNNCDLLLAAGSFTCHGTVDKSNFLQNVGLWGPNGTYRAVVGRALVSYQAIGLLPQCTSAPSMVTAGTAIVMSPQHSRSALANGKRYTNPSCLGSLSNPSWDIYLQALNPYVDVYHYSYGDFLGLDGTVTFSANALPQTLYQNLQVAQPVTITLQ